MQDRTTVALDHGLIELRAHQTLLMPVTQRPPLQRYTVQLMRAWNDSDIDIAVPTAHLISADGFSQASVIRALYRERTQKHVEIEVAIPHGRTRYHFVSRHRAPIAALQQRVDALPQRALALRQARIDQSLAATPVPSAMTLQLDPALRVDVGRLSRRTASGTVDIVFSRSAEAHQMVDMFGPIDAWRDGVFPVVRIAVDDRLAGLAHYALAWNPGATTNLSVEIGSRASSAFHQYMMQIAAHVEPVRDAVQLPIAAHELSRDELDLAITRLRGLAPSGRAPDLAESVTDEVWAHVLARRMVPRDLVYPSPQIRQGEWTRLCDDAVATQRLYQFCNDWFLQHTLPRLPLACFDDVFDQAGQDPTAYLQTVPPLLRQLEVPWSGLDHNQQTQACLRLRNAWLTAPDASLVPALQRHRLLRSSALLQALAEHETVVIEWLLPDPDQRAASPSDHAGWRAIIARAMLSSSPRHGSAAPYRRFMHLRHMLASAYPDVDQLRRAEFKRLLRRAGIYTSLHELALLEFEQLGPYQDQHRPPARVCFVDTLLQGGSPDQFDSSAEVYHLQVQAGRLAWDPTHLDRAALAQLLEQADSGARQLHQHTLTRYWAAHGATQSGGDDTHAMMLSAQACMAAHDLCQAGHLSLASLRLIIAAAGFGTSDAAPVHCHLLDLGGVASTDLVTIRAGDGAVVLYRPGHWPPFREYADMAAMRLALAGDCASDMARRQWAGHFPAAARTDSFKAGIDTLLLRLGCGEAIDQVALAEERFRIEGDIFHQVARRQQQRDLDRPSIDDTPGASPWSDAERFFDDDLALSAHPAAGPWMEALVAALDLREQGAPNWNRHSGLVPLPHAGVLALPPERQQDLLRAACRQEREQALWHERAPDIAVDGARYMQDFLRRRFPERFPDGVPDVATLVLNEYHPPQSHVAFYMFNDIGLLRRRKASIPLSELSHRNIDIVNAWDSLLNGGKRYFTVSHKDSAPHYYDEHFDNLVDPAALVAALIDDKQFDFATHHQLQIATYFAEHGVALTRLARERARLEAQLMRHEDQLSDADYRLAMSAFDPGAERDADTLAYPLRVAGHAARDCLHLHDQASGRRLLYLAGDDLPYRTFEHLAAARSFLLDLGGDRQTLDDFAHTHFAREHADDRRAPGGLRLTLVPGVISVLRTIDQAPAFNANPELAQQRATSRHDAIVRRRSLERLHGVLDERQPIGGDPFETLTAIAAQGAMADAAYFIRSASDRVKEEWMEYARIVPVDFVEGLVKLAVGKTADDLRMARRILGTDLILTLIPARLPVRRSANPVIAIAGSASVRALVHSASRREPVHRLARWFKPPQRINGRIGYALSPPRAHLWQRAERSLASALLDIRVFNATAQDARAIAHSITPRRSPLWYTVATQAIRLDRAASQFFEHFVAPQRNYLRELSNVDELFEVAYRLAPERGYCALGRGLVVGENHATTGARRFINDHLEQLAASGVKTLYTEVFKRDADSDLLRIFNAGGDFPAHVRARLRRLDANATPRSMAEFLDGRPSACLLTLFDNARRHGLEVRAIDNVTAAAADYLQRKFISSYPRLSSMNYVAYQIIRHDQAHFRKHAWVAHVGAGHAVRDHGIPGINEITATPSVFVHSSGDPTPLPLGDYHLAVDGAGPTPRLQSSA